jgi:RNA polymerase sigma-70 factor (ECF subfamily)
MAEQMAKEMPVGQENDLADILFRTSLLNQVADGSESAQGLLAPIIYQRLRQLARRFLSKERSGHTLQATDLVHEAYLRLFDQACAPENETHFVALAATMMRRVLINHALARKADKRGNGVINLTLGAAEFVAIDARDDEVDVIALDVALTKLSEIDERMAKVVELRYFGGMSIEDTALALSISAATVKREWKMAKLWLKKELSTQTL